MDIWHEKVKHLKAYNPTLSQWPDFVILSDKESLSPLTNFFLNTFINTMNKNLIFAIPDTSLRAIPLISYIYAAQTNKSVLVFTQKIDRYSNKNPVYQHYKNYSLLAKGSYLFLTIPIAVMVENTVDIKLYLPRGDRRSKKQYSETIKETFKENGPKILLVTDEDDYQINEVINNINIEDIKLQESNLSLDIGMVIFENTDRFVYSDYTLNYFLDWIKLLMSKNIKLLFHFSNPNSKYIDTIKESTSSFALLFGPTLLRLNESLKNASIQYYKREYNRNEWLIRNSYNIDSNQFYESITEIIPYKPLEAGNINYHFSKIQSIIKTVDEDKLIFALQYYSVITLVFRLIDISVNPAIFKVKFFDPINGWKYYTTKQIIERYREFIVDETQNNFELLNELLIELLCIYYELTECRRYGEKVSYSRIAKDYAILNLVKNEIENTDSNKMIIIATYSPIERNLLKSETENLIASENIVIDYIDRLTKTTNDRTNSTLILPGPLRLKYLSELMRTYYKIYIMSYEGYNFKQVKKQIELISIFSEAKYDKPLKYLNEIYNFLNIKKDGLLKDYSKIISKPKIINPGSDNVKQTNITDTFVNLNNILMLPKFSDLKKDEDTLEKIDKKTNEIEQRELNESFDDEQTCDVLLEKIDNNQTVIKKLLIDHTYLYLKDINADIEELFPRDFHIDSYLILIEDNEKKTMLDTIIEIFNLEESVDENLINLWKKDMIKYIEEKQLSYSEFYKLYVEKGGDKEYQTVRGWLKGHVLGPLHKNDLKIIGKIIGSDEIAENYQIIYNEIEYLRNIHRLTGRRIKKVINEIIKGNLVKSNLSFEESLLYEQIKNGIYKIKNVNI